MFSHSFPRILVSGSEKGVFWKRGLFRNDHFLEILESHEIPQNPQTVENKGESDQFLEIPEILEIPPVRRPLSQSPLCLVPIFVGSGRGEKSLCSCFFTSKEIKCKFSSL